MASTTDYNSMNYNSMPNPNMQYNYQYMPYNAPPNNMPYNAQNNMPYNAPPNNMPYNAPPNNVPYNAQNNMPYNAPPPYNYQYNMQYNNYPGTTPGTAPGTTPVSTPVTAPVTSPVANPMNQGNTNVKKDEKTEIKEAIEASEDALKHLYSAKKFLKKALRWGMFDVVGGDCLGTLFKQGNMSDARRELNAAEKAINKLNDELQDCNIDKLETGKFLDGVDLFLDNVFIDAIIQAKIKECREQCKRIITKVENVKKELEERLSKLE